MITYRCSKCGRNWNYQVSKCIFCKSPVDRAESREFAVIGATEVHVPSAGNEKVPYFVYLLQDADKGKTLYKSHDRHEIGDLLDLTPGEALCVPVISTLKK